MKASLFTKISSVLPKKQPKITIDDLATNIPKDFNAIKLYGIENATDIFVQEVARDTLTKPNFFQRIAQIFKK